MRYQSPCKYSCVVLSVWTSAMSKIVSGTSVTGASVLEGQLGVHVQIPVDFPTGQVKRTPSTKSCTIDGIENCGSTYYYYRDFEDVGGVTFAGAYAAIGIEADLEYCVLAPIYSYEDLIGISDVIPPCKAAYTAAFKDPVQVFRDAKECLSDGKIPFNCDFAGLRDTMQSMWGDDSNAAMGTFGMCSLEEWFQDDFTNGQSWCQAIKENWTNFGSSEAVPNDVWRAGDSSFCGEGPIQNAAAAFATDYSMGTPIAFLKALNSGEYLQGAVYKCCQDVAKQKCIN